MTDRLRFSRETARALQRRDYAELLRLCRAARAADPGFADPWFLESVAAEAGRDLGAALQFVDEALQRRPGHPEYLVQKARYHTQANQSMDARRCVDQALEAGVKSALLLDTLGVVLTRLGDYEQAAILLRQAVTAEPERPQFQFNLAAAEQFLGNENAAKLHYESVIRLAPGHARSYWALSELEKNSVNDRHEAAMLRLTSEPRLSTADALYLAHALARIDEHRGHYSAAIDRLAGVKAQRRRELAYSFDSDAALFAAVRRLSCQSSVPEPAGGPAPIFVVGLPRTGTTLVERILCAHSAVETFGEQQALPNAVKALSGERSRAVMSEAVLDGFSRQKQNLDLAYREGLPEKLGRLGAGVRYFIDKMPLNFFYIGMILEQLPGARVIVLRRNAMDAGLSNYRQLFALDYSYYNYSYDLGDTGTYVAAFAALMQHFQTTFGNRIHSVAYETLVDEPEQEMRSLLTYLNLDWEPACLSFYEQQGPVATPSSMQVRGPIYRGAVDRWKRYGEALDPLQAAIALGQSDGDGLSD